MNQVTDSEINTSWFQCTACSQPCEVLHLSTGSQSLCCDALVMPVMNQRILRSKLPRSHPEALRPETLADRIATEKEAREAYQQMRKGRS
jgi:hypothetical protein